MTCIVRVLSMPDARERRERFCAMMANLPPCDWRFQDAVAPSELSIGYDETQAFNAYGSILSGAEISCAASHIAMLREFVGEPAADFLLVVEDDVSLDPHFNIDARQLFMAECRVDYLKLAARFLVPSVYLDHVGRIVYYRAKWPPLGTQCYMLSRRGAAHLLERFEASGLYAPIDQMMDRFWETGLPIVQAFPFPAMELGFPSAIHKAKNALKTRNDELRQELGERPGRWQKRTDNLKRVMADRRLRRFDDALRGRIRAKWHDLRASLGK